MNGLVVFPTFFNLSLKDIVYTRPEKSWVSMCLEEIRHCLDDTTSQEVERFDLI